MAKRATLIVFVLVLAAFHGLSAEPNPGSDAAAEQLDRTFRDTVRPFVQTYCTHCHGPEKPKGGLDLSAFTTRETVARDLRRWQALLEQLHAGNMPPDKAKLQPKPAQRQEIIDWIKAVRRHEAKRNAGDPGPVFARRLSNAEYDNTIRDLTGVDIRPTKEFPVDPANEAGFDNSAESLTMSPALLKKYLEAARHVADHLVLKPDGLTFAPHPVITDTDRDKYCVRRIIDFYQRQPIDLADYFRAAWRFQHRAALNKPNATLVDIAAEEKVSAKYLATIWSVLTSAQGEIGPVAALQALWAGLPKPGPQKADPARTGCEQMRDFVVGLRQKLVPEVKNLTAPGIHNGSQCFVLWKNRQFAANRMRYAGGALQLQESGLTAGTVAARAMAVPTDPAAAGRYSATFERFCEVFPDAFFVSERARVYLDPVKEKKLGGRLLSAGFHSMTGYFRDDDPLYELILDRQGQAELDRLWQEFDFITTAPMRQHTSFIWFERTDSSYMRDPEFDVFRAEDKDVTSEAKVQGLAAVYLAKAIRRGAGEVAQEAITTHFQNISASIRRVEEAKRKSEPSHVKALEEFAERAFRRPLSEAEREGVAAFYRTLREQEGLSHEEAVRDTLASLLVSPHFGYLVVRPEAGAGVRPLSDYELANRLSYFLWSTLPDKELMERAAAGELHRPEVLVAQARRLLRDERVRGLAMEFGGNWLDFRRFEEHNSVDRTRFPVFNDELRKAMFEEPVRFFMDAARTDRSVLDFLYADHTFVNSVLAKHYGMPDVPGTPDDWVKVDDASKYGRGGLLPMSVFLTKNAPGLRTSPVKRGYWVVRRLLGENIPAPPAEVPELPNDEAKLGDQTLRQALAQHRANKSCAGCHERFDGIGLIFEGYGPIGERRAKDLGGRPVETKAEFPGGGEGDGLAGLHTYLREKRQQEFVDNLCRKLLAYGLGRSLLPSDDDAVDSMRARLASNGSRFGNLIESVVTSPQFLNKRSSGEPAKKGNP